MSKQKEKKNLTPPHLIKYMGAKTSIIEYIIENIDNKNFNGNVYDIFAGTTIVSAYLNRKYNVIVNDIQEYSTVLAKSYLNKINVNEFDVKLFQKNTLEYVNYFKNKYNLFYSYTNTLDIEEFIEIENQEKELLNINFNNDDNHLFVKTYSGTYWSFEQCLWIDSIYRSSQKYKNNNIYELLIGSLMFAMSYSSQSTGHFAQYRTVKDEKNMRDILNYRLKDVYSLFLMKLNQLFEYDRNQIYNFEVNNLSFEKILKDIKPNSLVYADPPYANVHYSRFYHALETIVKYDYPETKFKGRYRTDRHQSPFSKSSEAMDAFGKMFTLINKKQSHLVLSYSDGGVVTIEELLKLARSKFSKDYTVELKEKDYLHSRMGRKGEKSIPVKEILIIATFND
ncbi:MULTISPECIES: DNA adenine methylase [Empedobacter]|uniref:site-specific DNA-methyltransferase (adenine-specific) n=1 Tax=Empedobacter falsenii TaxID=343874 RepID=A0A376GJH0_9FLAO|nr:MULTISPECIES: DNA adenine methylase [Empedobacter]STD58557.1 Modification methylase FokI [Empedobacter falsenii]